MVSLSVVLKTVSSSKAVVLLALLVLIKLVEVSLNDNSVRSRYGGTVGWSTTNGWIQLTVSSEP